MGSQRRTKQERRKIFADLAIQGTNNSSIASKRSVELLYHPKLGVNKHVDNGQTLEYFKWFVPKTLKRSPCINRGYWLRLHAIRSRLDHITEATPGPIVVVNLGCGFDPLPFQLLDKRNGRSRAYWERVTFLDVDYPDLIAEKLSIIENSEELSTILGPLEKPGKFKRYALAPCNLNYPESFRSVVQSLGASTTIFIAEVSLAYMSPEHADDIISCCSEVPNSHFIMLEQLTPASGKDSFACQMLKHFAKNRSPLLSVAKYQTVESQRERFNQLGFPHVNAGDMLQLWDSLDESTRHSLQEIEPFDELEEFHLFAHHYLILHAAKEPFQFKKFSQGTVLSPVDTIDLPIEYLSMDNWRKFGDSVLDSKKGIVLYFGGSDPNRVNETISVDPSGAWELLTCENNPPPRTCHTFTVLDSDSAVVIGGRKNPVQGLTDTWILDLRSQKWARGPSLSVPRYRHASCLVQHGQVLVLGGKTTGSSALLINTISESLESVNTDLPTLISPAVDYNLSNRLGVVIGGSLDETHISDCLHLFTYADHAIKIIDTIRNPLFCRYGAQVKFISDRTVILLGGTGPSVFSASNSILLIDIHSKTTRGVRLPQPLPMLLGVSIQLLPSSKQLLVLGGGATCYGFGSVWNTGMRIFLQDEIK